MAASVINVSPISNTASIVITGTIVAGDTITAHVSGYHAAGYESSGVADSDGAYTLLKREKSVVSELTVETWVRENVSGSTNRTITVTPLVGSSNFYANVAIQSRGVATSSTLRDSGGAQALNTATDASATTDSTAAQVGDLVIGMAAVGIGGSSDVHFGAAASTGYTNAGKYGDYYSNTTVSVDYKVVDSGGTQTAAWSHDATTGATNGWVANIVVLKQAGGGGSTPAPQLLLLGVG